MIDIDTISKLTQSQGHKIKGEGQICKFIKKCFDYLSWTNDWILTLRIHLISIDGMLKLTQGQGHMVKGQGQIHKFVKHLLLLYIMNQWLDTDDTYTQGW